MGATPLRLKGLSRGWKEWEANSLTLFSQRTGGLNHAGAGYLVLRAFPARCSTVPDQGSAHPRLNSDPQETHRISEFML